MNNRALLDLLYEFIDSAYADHGVNPKEGIAGDGGQLVVSYRQLRVYARSFVGKQLAADSADQDYSAVLPAILGQWCVNCGRFTPPCTGSSPDCRAERHCGACGRPYAGERSSGT